MSPAEIKNSLRLALDAHPATCLFVYKYLLGYRWRPTWTRFVDASTDLVIDGFQRSANSFAFRTFEAAQPKPLRVAHHAHLSSQIVCAVRLKKPVLLLIREPVSTVASYVAVWPQASVASALGAYICFYQRVLPVLEHCQIADFETVKGDFSSVVSQLNARFGTTFACTNEAEKSAVYENLTVGQGSFRRSLNPDRDREERTAEIRKSADHQALSQAQSLYEKCLSQSSSM